MHQPTALTAQQPTTKQHTASGNIIYNQQQQHLDRAITTQDYVAACSNQSAQPGSLLNNTINSSTQQQQYNVVPATATSPGQQTRHQDDTIQMTRTHAYADLPMVSASNLHQAPPSMSAKQLDYMYNTAQMPNNNNNNNSSSSGSSNQQLMGKVLAHSTSLLANDSYIAGMSSDSELTTGSRHHHRPHSSQPRVYHAHPAPRGSHASSRMSHYSDSAASYGPPLALAQQTSVGKQAAAAGNPTQQTSAPGHLTHQGSVTSSGSGGSVSSPAYIGLVDSPISPLLQQQQQSAMSRPKSGRQLPHRPFKQSLSIDHHSVGQYHQHHHHHPHHAPPHHQQSNPIGQLNSSPAHSMSPHFEPADISGGGYHQQNYSAGSLLGLGQRINPQTSQMISAHEQMRYGQQQRNFRPEMEFIEKQAANINLYDNEPGMVVATSSVGLPPTATRPSSSSSSSAAAASSSSRQLPPTNPTATGGGSISVDHHQQHPIDQQYHRPDHLQQQQQQQKYLHHHHHQQQDLYTPQHQHQKASSPADWLPPMGLSSHHIGSRGAAAASSGTQQQQQFKQTMSIDHYPITAASVGQQQQHHYSPSRASHHFSEHYRGSLGYATSSPVCGYESSPTHQLGGYQSANSGDQKQHNDMIYNQQQQYGTQQQEQQLPPQLSTGVAMSSPSQLQQQNQQIRGTTQDLPQQIQPHNSTHHHQHHHHHHQRSSSSNFSQSLGGAGGGRGGTIAPLPGQQQMQPKLQHQASSSSSNSQSGSLKSSNIDINKSLTDHQKASTLSHFQHHQSPQHNSSGHRHGASGNLLRKGYTSAVSGLGNSNTALSESGDLSLTQQTTTTGHSGGGLHLASHSGKRSALRAISPSAALEAATSSGGQHHHSISSRDGGGSRSESSTGLPNGAANNSNNNSSLTKKSNSATQLSMTGTKKRLGFRKKQVTSFSVHRSEEVAPLDARHLVKQGSSVSEGDSSMSGDSSSRSWSNSNFKQQTSDELASMSFIDGLGKGQMISRQGLASPYLGDIQLSLCDRRGNLEIEVIRARNLQAKANKILPLTYVKLYLVKNRKCLAKAKTTLSNKRNLDPLFQQQLTFHEDYHGCILQSIVWGNFGKMDKKNFMGIAQISIDDLELSDTVISWYKLFLPSSLQTLPSKSLRHTLLSNSTESFTNTNNS